MILQEGHLQFEFNKVIDAFKFDEKDRSKETFHGLSHCMKAVDFIIETEEYYHFVEVKDYSTASENYFEDNYTDVINVNGHEKLIHFYPKWSRKLIHPQ